MRGEDVARTREVSREWYNDALRAREVKSELTDTQGSGNEIRSIGVTVLDNRIDGLRSHGVEINLPRSDQNAVPNEIDGVPIVKRDLGEFEGTCYQGNSENIKGGHGHNWYNTDGDRFNASLCCRVEKNNTKYMMACRHVFIDDGRDNDNCSSEDVTGEYWYKDGDLMGDVEYGYQNHDMTLLRNWSDKELSDWIVDTSGSISGRVTKDGLDYLASNDVTVHKRGITTCKESGGIESYGNTDFCGNGNYVSGVVNTSIESKDGDSGGPVFHKTSNPYSADDLWIININTHKPKGESHGRGASANDMHNKRDIIFGDSSYS